jgi:outer membrane immunogenic protein
MKKTLISSVAFGALLAGSAMAADMPLRMPVKAPPPPVETWTGFYLGINGGGSIGHSPTTDGQIFNSPTPALNGIILGNESFNHSPIGGIFGGQAGFNWQLAPNIVWGVEADGQWSGEKDTASLFACGTQNTAFFGPGGQAFNECLSDEQKLRWFATARARLGWADSRWLWYVTGGGAWGQVEDNETLGITPAIGFTTAGPLLAGVTAASFTHTKGGWTVGGGVETKLWSGWSVKLEYLFVDLGSYTDSFTIAAAAPGNTVTTSTTSHFQDHIVRAGLNYRFWGGY